MRVDQSIKEREVTHDRNFGGRSRAAMYATSDVSGEQMWPVAATGALTDYPGQRLSARQASQSVARQSGQDR